VGDDKLIWFGTDIIPRDGGFIRWVTIPRICIRFIILGSWVSALIWGIGSRTLSGRTARTILRGEHGQFFMLRTDSMEVDISLVSESLVPEDALSKGGGWSGLSRAGCTGSIGSGATEQRGTLPRVRR
jgi:hypothetical protein